MTAADYILKKVNNGGALIQFAKLKANGKGAPKSLERYLLGALLNSKTRRPDKDAIDKQ